MGSSRRRAWGWRRRRRILRAHPKPVPLSPAAREEFVFAKLRREEQEEGLYIIRWSALDFNRMILSVVKRGQQQVRCDSRCSVPGNGELRAVPVSLGDGKLRRLS